MDLKLTDYDLDLTGGDLSFVEGKQARAQDIQMALRTWLGETPYDTTAGVPWLQAIFSQPKNPNIDAIRFILERRILDRPGVLGVQLDPVFDRSSRVLTITGTANTVDGEIDFTEIIEA